MLSRLFTLLLVVLLAGCAHQNAQKSDRSPYAAVDTSRTIDLTNPPADIWDRVRRGFAIPNLNDPLVDHWTNYYASHPQSVYRMSERAKRYIYFIVDELERRGLPTELALLPFVESAYNPEAYSRAKASGLWQFIPSTGLHFNLKQDSWRDERRDPVASTHAALEYLTYLYEFQGDWYLALASYNWGEGSVRRAIEKAEAAGDGTDYLSLKMPDETRNYVPKLQAIKNIIADPKKYGMTLPPVSNTPYFTAIRKTQTMAVEDVARLAEMPLEEFKALNASFHQSIIVADDAPEILLPTHRVDIFKANLEAYKNKQLIAAEGGVQLASLDTTGGAAAPMPTPLTRLPSAGKPATKVVKRGPSARTHTVKKGETLYALAKRYNTSVQELRRLNNLKSNNLGLGTRLRVPGTNVRG